MAIDANLLASAGSARGFMPPDEGLALFDAAEAVSVPGPFLEVGSYCGKSAIYMGAAAKAQGRVLFALDHHRGSEENQAGWEHHEPDLVDPSVGKMDTLPTFRRTIHDAGLEGTVGESPISPMTVPSRPASWIVRRKVGSVSILPVEGSTRSGSWCSHPAWFSSLPRW